MNQRYQFPGCIVLVNAEWREVTTVFVDGAAKRVKAARDDEDCSASVLGYGDTPAELLRRTVEQEIYPQIVADILGLEHSFAQWMDAHTESGMAFPPDVVLPNPVHLQFERELIAKLQAFLNGVRYATVDIEHLAEAAGVTSDGLRQEFALRQTEAERNGRVWDTQAMV